MEEDLNQRLSLAGWHSRFEQQAQWTSPLRRYLFERARIQAAGRILDVGCGTGVLLAGLPAQTQAQHFGLDILPERLKFARSVAPGARFVGGDGLSLPFPPGIFDLVFCHFLLLWVSDPRRAVTEMSRVAHPGGWVLALAEPDYGGRIDYPDDIAELGRLQTQALRRQGADPHLGRRLGEIFTSAGLVNVEVGLLGGQWRLPYRAEDWDMEWQVMENDLAGRLSPSEIEVWKKRDRQAYLSGSRILYVPTFYAVGTKPE